MERNLTQSEFAAINARRAANGKEPLTYRDANRQARRLTSRQRIATAEDSGIAPREVSSGARVADRERGQSSAAAPRPPTPPRSRRSYEEDDDHNWHYAWNNWGEQWDSQQRQDWRDWRWNEADDSLQMREAEPVHPEVTASDYIVQEVSSSEPECEEASSSVARIEGPAVLARPGEQPLVSGASPAGSSGDVAAAGPAVEMVVDPRNLFRPPLSNTDLPDDAMAERLSRLLTAALRHKPEDFGLRLQDDGFADLEDVTSKRAFYKHGASPRMLAAVGARFGKKRFVFKLEGRQVYIAASHGHSRGILRSLALFQEQTVETAPRLAYHATQFRKWAGISTTGLQRMEREHVHLALQADQESGMRQGQDLLIAVAAQEMVASGITLLRSITDVLLTPGVTSRGILPLHFIVEIRNLHTGRPHVVPQNAGDCGSLWLTEGRTPPMPSPHSQGGPADWNQPSLWSHVRARSLAHMPSLAQDVSPTQLLVSFLSARGLKDKVEDRTDVLAEEGEVWRGLRVQGGGAEGETETYFHGTHLFALSSILQTGLKPSTSEEGTRTLHIGDTPLDGVYSFTRLQQVLFYCPYILLPLTALGKSPWTAAVRVSLELKAEPQANQRRGKRTNQFILAERKVRVSRIWIQVKSPASLQPGESFTNWQPNLEAPV